MLPGTRAHEKSCAHEKSHAHGLCSLQRPASLRTTTLSDFHWRMILVLVTPRRKGVCVYLCVVCLPTCMVYVLCCCVFGVMDVCMLMYVSFVCICACGACGMCVRTHACTFVNCVLLNVHDFLSRWLCKTGQTQQLEAPAGWFLAQGVLEPQDTQEGFC